MGLYPAGRTRSKPTGQRQSQRELVRSSRQDPTPKVALGRLIAVDFDVEPALVKGSELCSFKPDGAAQRTARRRRDGEIGDDGAARSGQGTRQHVRPGWNGEQSAERTLQREFIACERGCDRAASGAIGACADQARTRRQPDWKAVGGRRGAQQCTEKTRPEQKISCALRCAPDSAQAREN